DSLQGDGSLSEQLDDVGELFGEKKLGLAEVLLDSCDLDAAVLQAGDEVVDFVLVEVEVEAVEVFAETLASDLGVSIKSDQLLNGDGSDFDGVDELADGFVPEVGMVGDGILEVVEAGGDVGLGGLGVGVHVGEGG